MLNGWMSRPANYRNRSAPLKCILEEHIAEGTELKSLYAGVIARRKYHSRSKVGRCTGSTLLVKGLDSLGVYTALITEDTQELEKTLKSIGDRGEVSQQELEQLRQEPLLMHYRAFATGAGIDDDLQYPLHGYYQVA